MITQVDIGSTQQAKSPKHLIGAHQTRVRADSPNKNIYTAIFDNPNLQTFFIEIDSIRYTRKGVLIFYVRNDYIEPNKDLKLFFKEYVGEEAMTLVISYPDVKTNSSLEV